MDNKLAISKQLFEILHVLSDNYWYMNDNDLYSIQVISGGVDHINQIQLEELSILKKTHIKDKTYGNPNLIILIEQDMLLLKQLILQLS